MKILDIISMLLILTVSSHAEGLLLHKKPLATIEGVVVERLTYQSDGLKVHGELYLPPSSGKLPLVIFNHDGISGISRSHRLSAVRLALAGYVVFCPSYRGEDGSEGVVEIAKGEVRDVLHSLPFLKAHPRVNPHQIAFVGASHGALISILAAARYPEVKAVVSAYGVMDIYQWYAYLKKTGQLGHDLITERTYGLGPAKRPQSFAVRNAVSVVPHLTCPILLLQGALDTTVPPEQAKIMKAALDRAGKSVTLKIYPDALHGFLVYAPYLNDASKAEKAQTRQAWTTMLNFLKSHLTPS